MAEKDNEEEINKIIERLREREKEKRNIPIEQKAGDIKARLEGLVSSRPLNFKKVSFEKNRTPLAKFVGGFYSRFEKPISRIALMLSRTSISQNIRRELIAADISMSPEEYLITVSTLSMVASIVFLMINLMVSIVLFDFTFAAVAPILSIIIFVGSALGGLLYPSMQARSRAIKCNRELPYALRQLATQVKAGVSFHRSLISISESDYGLLSEEFKKTLRDLDSGMTLEESLFRLSYRIKSKGIKKMVTQIIRAIKVGGNLSEMISGIADEISFESRMRIRDFTEKLNMINVIYIMVSVVAPVTVTIFASIMQLPMFSGSFPAYLVPFSFIGIVIGMGAILYVTRILEPMV